MEEKDAFYFICKNSCIYYILGIGTFLNSSEVMFIHVVSLCPLRDFLLRGTMFPGKLSLTLTSIYCPNIFLKACANIHFLNSLKKYFLRDFMKKWSHLVITKRNCVHVRKDIRINESMNRIGNQISTLFAFISTFKPLLTINKFC